MGSIMSAQPSMIRRAVEGDRDALDRLCSEYRTVLIRFARRIAPEADDGHVNEILLRVLELMRDPRREFDERFGEKFTAWLYAVAENVMRHERRTRRPVRWIDARSSDTDGFRPIEPVSRGTSPSMAAVRAEMREVVRARIELLPPLYRDVIRLHWINGMPCADIARKLKVDEDTVRKRLQRAHDRLRVLVIRTRTTLHGLSGA